MLRTILAVLFAVCYLILGIPVLFVEWLIGKRTRICVISAVCGWYSGHFGSSTGSVALN